jgi:hypothetical protein
MIDGAATLGIGDAVISGDEFQSLEAVQSVAVQCAVIVSPAVPPINPSKK